MEETGGNQTQQPQVQPQVQTAPTKTISWLKLVLTILVIVVATAIIAGTYWFFVLSKSSPEFSFGPIKPKPGTQVATPSATPSAQKDETADWKTYSNSVGKYSLKYPPKLEVYDLQPGAIYDPTKSSDLVITDKDLSPYQPGAQKTLLEPSFELLKIDISSGSYDQSPYAGLSFSEVAKKLWNENKNAASKPKSITNLKSETFAGKAAYSFTETGVGSYTGVGGNYLFGGKFDLLKVVIVKVDDNYIQIIYKPTETIEKLLNTFKFLSSTNSE